MANISPDKVHQSLNRFLIPDVLPLVVDLEQSRGSILRDSLSGRDFLDCNAFVASNTLGFNHPKLSDPEFEKKLLRAAKIKTANSDFYTVEMAEFVDTFARVAKPKEFSHLFFIEGGTLAVENALKVAFDWKVRKNLARGIPTESALGSQVIHFAQCFHGRSGYCLSLTNSADPRKTKFFPKFNWPRVLNPKLRFPITEEILAEVQAAEELSLAQIKRAFDEHPDDIAAIIIEPIQCEGGDNHFRASFHQKLRQIADQREALLIYDEVQTGLGASGKFWAYQHYGITPDIVTFGKKMQLCGLMAGPRIDQVPDNVFVEASRLNSTWGGGLSDMVRCQRFLEIIEEDKLVENAAKTGAFLLEKIGELSEEFPKTIENPRGLGFIAAFDGATPAIRDAIVEKCYQAQVLLLRAGTKTIRLRPALCFSKSEVERLLTVLRRVLQSLR